MTSTRTSHEVTCADRITEDHSWPDPAAHPHNRGLSWSVLPLTLLLVVPSIGCTHKDESPASNLIVELTDANFHQELMDAKQPVLVEFWAPWCEPCLEMAPAIEQLATQFSGRARVARIRIDENPATAFAYSIDAPPAVIVFRDGDVFKRRHGRQSAEELAVILSESLIDGDSN